MIRELVTIEFNYMDVPKNEDFGGNKTKIITIGMFDTFEEAATEANKALEALETHFKLNPHYNLKERFSKTGGCFGYPVRLITQLGYLETPFHFSVKITKHECGNISDIEETIIEVLKAKKRYLDYKIKQEEKDDNA